MVNHECLEVEEVPGTWWQGFKWVNILLCRFLFSSWLWLWFLLLLLLLLFGLFTTCSSFFEIWLACFTDDLAFAEDCLAVCVSHDTLIPFEGLGCWFAESLIENSHEW